MTSNNKEDLIAINDFALMIHHDHPIAITIKGDTNIRFLLENRCHQSLRTRSEEHTSELQSRENLVCRLLLEKKKKTSSFYPTAQLLQAQDKLQLLRPAVI